jgi:hypothetical protein
MLGSEYYTLSQEKMNKRTSFLLQMGYIGWREKEHR